MWIKVKETFAYLNKHLQNTQQATENSSIQNMNISFIIDVC